MAKTYAFESFILVLRLGAFVHPTAVLIGDVVIAEDGHIGHAAVIHGCTIGRDARWLP